MEFACIGERVCCAGPALVGLVILTLCFAPFVLFGCVEAPGDDIACAAPVVVPGCIVCAPAFSVKGHAEEGLEGWLELLEED